MSPSRSLRLSLPFTILTAPDTVRLVAGEDFRCSLTAPGLETWLPALLSALDGRRALSEVLADLAPDRRAQAAELLGRLFSERFLVDATALERHTARPCVLRIEGDGELADFLRAVPASRSTATKGENCGRLTVLCQDRLDYEAALAFNRRCRVGNELGLWTSTGAGQRGYVGPVLLPNAGPCLACLFSHFRRLSPAPEFYDFLAEHARQGRPILPTPFPTNGMALLAHLVLWKRDLLEEDEAPAALYRLHVLESATLEIGARRVPTDPECLECGG